MICRNPIVSGESQLQRASNARTMYCDYKRSPHLLNRIEKMLALLAQPLRFVDALELEKLLDVRAGNEAVLFSADEDRSANIEVALEPVEKRDELVLHRAIDLVDRFAGQVDGDDSDPAYDLR